VGGAAGSPFDGPVRLIGRADEHALATASLPAGGCLIVGAAGVGKSRLAAAVAADAAAGSEVVHVTATESAAAVALGAFSHLLPPVRAGSASPIPALIDRFRSVATVLLLDDAHLLDRASAALVLALAQTRACPIVATVRSRAPSPDAVTALWKDRRLLRVELQPLARDHVAELVDAFLGGPGEGGLHHRVFATSEGNPLFVREFLADAQSSGALTWARGTWRLNGTRPRLERLRELIAHRTRGLGPAARYGLELLALAAPLEATDLRALAGSGAIEELERSGIATRAGTGGTALTLAHPLFGEVVREHLAPEAARRLKGELAGRLEGGVDLTPLDVVRVAAWKLDAGDPSEALCLRACRTAVLNVSGVPGTGWGSADPELALRLADAAGAGLEPALHAARASLALDRFADVEARLAPWEADASRADAATAAGYVRTRALALRWDGAGASAAALVDRAGGWRREADWAAELAGVQGWIHLYDGAPARAVERLGACAGRPEIAASARLNLLVPLVLALGRLGLTDRCERLEPEVQALAREVEAAGGQTGWAHHAVDCFARVEAARDLPAVADRLAAAQSSAERRGDEPLAAGFASIAGRLALLRGHHGDAIRLLERAVSGLASGDPRNALGLCLGDLAQAHAIRSDVAAAAAALCRAEDERRTGRGVARLELRLALAEAWLDVAHGRLEAARRGLLAIAEESERDQPPIAADAVHSALRLGADPAACSARLRRLEHRTETELIGAYARHAAAVAARDGRGQLDAARRFAALGLDLLCAEAAAGASGALADEGRQASARTAATLARTHAARCQHARTPGLVLTGEVAELTRREQEIALLAALGETNAEIAERLVISVRTVETHLYRTFRKLGIGDRESLAELIADGAPAGHRRR
jgi:DNA-binding NarL/FixJ family response regulator